MLQCTECEFYQQKADGAPRLLCNPFSTIKEPECLTKWQLVQLSVIADSHQATLDMYPHFAPLQEKMFQHMEREIDDVNEADRWKSGDDDDDSDNNSY